MKKVQVFVMVDGIGDVGVEELGWKTPLEAARTPTLDGIAAAGSSGLLDPVEVGLGCGSDTAHLSIFGYPPQTYYRGRGAFESMGAGLEMIPGDIAFKCNFATLDPESRIVLSRRADRNFEELGPVLCSALDGIRLPSFPGYTVAVRYATEHRCGIRVRGANLTDTVSGTDPLKDGLPLLACEPTSNSDESYFTSDLVNELSQEIMRVLRDHPVNVARVKAGKPPANVVLLRGCGVRLQVEPFAARHGLRGFMVAPTCIIRGLGMTLGMDVVDVKGATGDYHTDLLAKSRAVAEQLAKGDHEFAFLHVKAVDDCGHDRNVPLKVSFLEKVDEMVADLVGRLHELEARSPNTRFMLCVTGDHSTPCLFGDHSCEPVPLTVCAVEDLNRPMSRSPTRCLDRVSTFDEIAAAQGALGRFPGSEVMQLLKKFLILS